MIQDLVWGAGPIIITTMLLRDWWHHRRLMEGTEES